MNKAATDCSESPCWTVHSTRHQLLCALKAAALRSPILWIVVVLNLASHDKINKMSEAPISRYPRRHGIAHYSNVPFRQPEFRPTWKQAAIGQPVMKRSKFGPLPNGANGRSNLKTAIGSKPVTVMHPRKAASECAAANLFASHLCQPTSSRGKQAQLEAESIAS